MSYPILYSPAETDFENNGIGILSSCISCEVTEEANGAFEMAMQYPMNGLHFEDIGYRSIIKSKADRFRDPQLFRVYKISKPMSGVVKVLCEHISYDLSGIPVQPFTATSLLGALSGLKENAVSDCPFDFWTDKSESSRFSVDVPSSIRSKLGGSAGSILDVYGGEYEFDNFTVKLHNNRGFDRGVSIRYGKNLKNIKQDQNCASVYTGIYPYWAYQDEKGNKELVELPEKIINASGEYGFERVKTVDFSNSFEKKPSENQLREVAQKYVVDNQIGVPVVSLTISYLQLDKIEEYKHLDLLERVSLCDTVNVEFPMLRVSATAKVVKIVYDALAERIISATLGSIRANIADTILKQTQEIQKKPSKTFLEIAVEFLTNTILGASGGSVRFLDTNEDGEPDTLYIADDPDPFKAVKVWRFNHEGWGASENGYNGPFKMGATLDGGIVADFITAGTLYGLLFKAGMIESLDGKIKVDLSSGGSAVFNSGISCNGINVRADSIGAKSALKVGTTETTAGKQLVSIIGTNELNETFLTLRESFDPEDEKTGGYLGLFGGDENSATMQSNTYGGSIYLTSKFGGNILLEASSEDSLKSRIVVDVISPGEKSDFAWEYIPSIGKTMLVRV